MALAAQRHEEAISQSGGQIRGGDDHCVWAHSMKKVHYLQTVSERLRYWSMYLIIKQK